MGSTKVTTEDVLQELAERYYKVPIQDGDITSQMLATKLCVSKTTAENHLRNEVKEGRMIELKRTSKNGKDVNVWRKVDPVEE